MAVDGYGVCDCACNRRLEIFASQDENNGKLYVKKTPVRGEVKNKKREIYFSICQRSNEYINDMAISASLAKCKYFSILCEIVGENLRFCD